MRIKKHLLDIKEKNLNYKQQTSLKTYKNL